jgi:hypothetical protein
LLSCSAWVYCEFASCFILNTLVHHVLEWAANSISEHSVTAVSALRLQFLVRFGSSTNPTWDMFPTSYWSTVELNVSVCCACMPSMRLILERIFPKVLGSTRDRLHDSPISLSRHRRALTSGNADPTSKIVLSREFQVEYFADSDESERNRGKKGGAHELIP